MCRTLRATEVFKCKTLQTLDYFFVFIIFYTGNYKKELFKHLCVHNLPHIQEVIIDSNLLKVTGKVMNGVERSSFIEEICLNQLDLIVDAIPDWI